MEGIKGSFAGSNGETGTCSVNDIIGWNVTPDSELRDRIAGRIASRGRAGRLSSRKSRLNGLQLGVDPSEFVRRERRHEGLDRAQRSIKSVAELIGEDQLR